VKAAHRRRVWIFATVAIWLIGLASLGTRANAQPAPPTVDCKGAFIGHGHSDVVTELDACVDGVAVPSSLDVVMLSNGPPKSGGVDVILSLRTASTCTFGATASDGPVKSFAFRIPIEKKVVDLEKVTCSSGTIPIFVVSLAAGALTWSSHPTSAVNCQTNASEEYFDVSVLKAPKQTIGVVPNVEGQMVDFYPCNPPTVGFSSINVSQDLATASAQLTPLPGSNQSLPLRLDPDGLAITDSVAPFATGLFDATALKFEPAPDGWRLAATLESPLRNLMNGKAPSVTATTDFSNGFTWSCSLSSPQSATASIPLTFLNQRLTTVSATVKVECSGGAPTLTGTFSVGKQQCVVSGPEAPANSCSKLVLPAFSTPNMYILSAAIQSPTLAILPNDSVIFELSGDIDYSIGGGSQTQSTAIDFSVNRQGSNGFSCAPTTNQNDEGRNNNAPSQFHLPFGSATVSFTPEILCQAQNNGASHPDSLGLALANIDVATTNGTTQHLCIPAIEFSPSTNNSTLIGPVTGTLNWGLLVEASFTVNQPAQGAPTAPKTEACPPFSGSGTPTNLAGQKGNAEALTLVGNATFLLPRFLQATADATPSPGAPACDPLDRTRACLIVNNIGLEILPRLALVAQQPIGQSPGTTISSNVAKVTIAGATLSGLGPNKQIFYIYDPSQKSTQKTGSVCRSNDASEDTQDPQLKMCANLSLPARISHSRAALDIKAFQGTDFSQKPLTLSGLDAQPTRDDNNNDPFIQLNATLAKEGQFQELEATSCPRPQSGTASTPSPNPNLPNKCAFRLGYVRVEVDDLDVAAPAPMPTATASPTPGSASAAASPSPTPAGFTSTHPGSCPVDASDRPTVAVSGKIWVDYPHPGTAMATFDGAYNCTGMALVISFNPELRVDFGKGGTLEVDRALYQSSDNLRSFDAEGHFEIGPLGGGPMYFKDVGFTQTRGDADWKPPSPHANFDLGKSAPAIGLGIITLVGLFFHI